MSDTEELEGYALLHYNTLDSDDSEYSNNSDSDCCSLSEAVLDIERNEGQSHCPVSNAKELPKIELQKLVEKGSERVTVQPNSDKAATSAVWNDFKLLFVDGKQVKYVKCNSCTTIYSWTSALGTRALNRHLPCTGPKARGKPKATCTGPLDNFLIKKIPASEEAKLNRKIVTGLALDLRPLSSVSNEGFLMMAQALVDFGAKHGHVKIAEKIQHRTTMRNSSLHCPQQSWKLRKLCFKFFQILL